MASVIAAVGTNKRPGLQPGIGRSGSREPEAVAIHVLNVFLTAERDELAVIFERGESLLRERGYL